MNFSFYPVFHLWNIARKWVKLTKEKYKTSGLNIPHIEMRLIQIIQYSFTSVLKLFGLSFILMCAQF